MKSPYEQHPIGSHRWQHELRGLSLIRLQSRVWLAVMLRDMRSRFFGNWIGYIFLIGWPIGHIGILLLINSLRGRPYFYGQDLILYLTVGFLPLFNVIYMSRQTVIAMVLNISLFSFPIVKPLDLLVGHAALEVINAFLVSIIVFAVLSILGIDFYPRHPMEALFAFFASIYLGIGLAVLNGVIVFLFRPWVTGYALVAIILYISSGAIIDVEGLPDRIVTILEINPVLHLVIWMRGAYFDGYGANVLSREYPLLFATFAILIGLFLERLTRGRILKQ